MKLAKFFTVRKVLSYLLFLSIVYAAYGIYYKVKYWGFSLTPKNVTDIWRIDAKISFIPVDKKVHVEFATPGEDENFNILSEELLADGYDVLRDEKNNKVIVDGQNKEGKQTLYYRLSIYDDVKNSQINKKIPQKVERPILSDEEKYYFEAK